MANYKLRDMIDNLESEGPSGVISGLRKGSMKYIAAGAAVLSMMIGYASFRHKVDDTEVGVRFSKITGASETYGPGTHFFPPVINDWYKLDTKLEATKMTTVSGEGDRKGSDPLMFKTRDGNEIQLNLTIPYRLRGEDAANIIRNVGQSNEEVREKIVRAYARSIPRDHFGTLNSQDFANTTDRNRAAADTEKNLVEVLEPYGIAIDNVDTGQYEFLNPEYKRLVQDKKIADAKLPAVIASLEAQKQDNLRMLNAAEKQKKQDIATMDGELGKAQVEWDAYLAQKTSEAEGILARGRNNAQAIVKEREAMKSQGGLTLVKMQIAECLADKKIEYIPMCSDGSNSMQLQTMDIGEMMSLIYGVSQEAAQNGK